MSKSKKVQKAAQKKPNIYKIGAIIIPILLVVVIAVALINNNLSNTSSPAVKDSDLIIQVSDITEQGKFYPVEIEGTTLEVLAVKASDGSIRTAFNTCRACYSSGRGYYKQDGNVLACQNCGNRFDMDDIEVTSGGCNPVPITSESKTVTDSTIIVSKEFLTETKVIFASWR